MSFYDKKKIAMLNSVSYFLDENKDKLAGKVPAMKDFADQFIEKHKALNKLIYITYPQKVTVETGGKSLAQRELVAVIAKLIAVLNAADYKVNKKPLPEMGYSENQIRKFAAAKLTLTFMNLFTAVKKLKQLPYYGLAEADLRDMEAYYNEFKGRKSAPKKKKKEMADNRTTIVKEIKGCVDFLKKKIDRMMLIAAEGNTALQYDYKSRRKVFPRTPGRPSDKAIGYRKSRKQKIRMSAPGNEGPAM
jgi:hypothetical protein